MKKPVLNKELLLAHQPPPGAKKAKCPYESRMTIKGTTTTLGILSPDCPECGLKLDVYVAVAIPVARGKGKSDKKQSAQPPDEEA